LKSFVKRPEFDLQIAGDGPLGPQLRKQFAGFANIHFLGNLPHSSIEALFSRATAVISPSWGPEVFGLTVLESMACGTPVIVRRAGGSTEVIEQTSGGLAYDNPEELLPHVDRLATDPSLRQSLSENALRAVSRDFGEERWLERYFGLIDRYRTG
jgi:glycosyltransferase involved in cell wall biosynthesis